MSLRPQRVVLHRHEEAWMLLKLSEVKLRKKHIPVAGNAETPTDRLVLTSNEVRNEMKLYEEALSCAQEAEEEL